MKIKLPDYSNCIANLANSILSEFGIKEEGRVGLTEDEMTIPLIMIEKKTV